MVGIELPARYKLHRVFAGHERIIGGVQPIFGATGDKADSCPFGDLGQSIAFFVEKGTM